MQTPTKPRSLLDAIGNTPLVTLPLDTPAEILVKLEYLNPGGSIKDRTARYMIEQAEQSGQLKPGGTIIEASSGNQGIAIAMIGAIKGYRVIITVSEKVSEEKKRALQAYGAKLVVCPATDTHDDPRNYHNQAVTLQRTTPNSFMPNQYFNLANPQAYYETLGPEIWKQTEGRITHYIAAAGTGGQISGTGRYLKKHNPKIKVIAVDAATSFHATHGQPQSYKMEGIGLDFDTPCLNESVIDEFIGVSDEQGIGFLPTLASKYGLLVGPSSGAVAYAVNAYRPQLDKHSVVVAILSDSGRAYLSKNYYQAN